MKCKKCKSEDLRVISSGPHHKLVCLNCLAFRKFLSAPELKTFNSLNVTSKYDEHIKVLEMIAKDMKDDATNFDGREFNGKNVAEYCANQGAAIAALADIIKAICVKLDPKPQAEETE